MYTVPGTPYSFALLIHFIPCRSIWNPTGCVAGYVSKIFIRLISSTINIKFKPYYRIMDFFISRLLRYGLSQRSKILRVNFHTEFTEFCNRTLPIYMKI